MSWNFVNLQQPTVPIFYTDERPQLILEKVSFEYESGGGYPGEGQTLNCDSGKLIVTNIRVIYLPYKPGVILQSFSAPLQNLEDGKVSLGWLHGDSYFCVCKSVPHEGFSNEWGNVKFGMPKGTGNDFMNYLSHLRSRLGELPTPYIEPLPTYRDTSSSAHPPSYGAPPPGYQ
jgi:hypothetical protein